VTSAAAILSLALAIGTCMSAFRLIDALLLRPLPVAEPERLYVLSREGFGFNGKPNSWDTWAYPAFQQMRAAVKDQAALIAITAADRTDLTYGSDQETERAYVQNVSGWMFGSFGLRPALGRLLTESDDLKPSAHPFAVLSHDYWTRRFGKDPTVIGRTFQMGTNLYQIVGVAEERFTATEPGAVTDIFIPTMMRAAVLRSDANWFRTWVRMNPGAAVEPARQRLDAASQVFERERAKGFLGMPKAKMDRVLNQKLLCEPATAGVSRKITAALYSLSPCLWHSCC
jgi:putative ABC transport system permease protein